MIIITGGAGFIGSCLLAQLNCDGEKDILLVDNLGKTEKWKNLVGKRFRDLISKEIFRELLAKNGELQNTSVIFHLGACSTTTEKDADYLFDNNFRYSRELCQWAVARDCRFIYASSGATYGLGLSGYDDSDSHTPKNEPLNMYGYSKQLFDEWILENRLQNKVVGLKFFNVYGPNEYHKDEMASVVFKQFPSAKAGRPLKLFKSYLPEYKDGEQKRDFVYVKDCVKIMQYFSKNKGKSGIFNLGSGNARSWNDLANALYAACGAPPKIEYVEMPDHLQGKYQYFTEANIQKLRSVGYSEPMTNLETGIRDYVSNYLMTNRHW